MYLSAITPGWSNDACGCETCCSYAITFRTADNYAMTDPISGFEFCDCDDTVVELNIPWPFGLGSVNDLCPEASQQFLDRAAASTVNIRLEIDPCECGACCTEGECESPTTEFYCNTENRRIWLDIIDYRETEWQGVGTDCDPSPCES
jgi:hypothetical protein